MKPTQYLFLLAAPVLLNCYYAASSPCPEHWISEPTEENCYRLFYESSSWSDALKWCNSLGANLLSLSHASEYDVVKNILRIHDLRNEDWWTSGQYSAKMGWEWQEDGSLLTYDRWRKDKVPTSGNLIITHDSGQYLWKSSKPSARHPFICEISFPETFKAISSNRRFYAPFTFGLSGSEKLAGHMPPKLVLEPETTTNHLGNLGPRTFIRLECKARAIPNARIRWFKSSGEEVKSSKNIMKVGGTLLFIQMSKADFGSYHCMASNMYGTVRSRTASMSLAYINDFPSKRMNTYAIEGNPLSIPCEEHDHFPRTYFFGWIYDSVNKFVVETDRIFVSRDGTLYFSHVLKQDAKSYACNMVNYKMHMGHYGPFFDLKVDSPAQPGLAKKQSAPYIPEDFIRISPQQPELGKPVWIECFAYARPAPKYYWDMVGGSELPSGIRQREFNRVLYIPQFQTHHVGTYRCTASNSAGKSAKQIQLLFSSAPQYLTELEDKFVTLNDTFELLCDVFANPAPHFEWFRNGSPLSPLLLTPGDQARISIRENRLTVKFAHERDSAVYQCIASNSLGEKSASAYISVRGFKPNFEKQQSETKVFASNEDYVILPCPCEASPTPLYSWKKDGQAVKYDSKIILSSNGSLKIGHVSPDDSGEYYCSASNRFGYSDGKIVLDVVGNLNLKMNPDTPEIKLLPGENLTISCSMQSEYCKQTDGVQCPEIAFSWTFNDFSLCDLPQWREQKISTIMKHKGSVESELTLIGASSLHIGTLICRGDTLAGHTSRSIRINVSSPPPAPIGVKSIIDSDSNLKLSWRMPTLPISGGYQGGVDSYKLEAAAVIDNSNNDEDEWFLIEEDLKSHHPVVDNFVMKHRLKPFTLYKFRVKAHNSVGWGAASSSSEPIKTKPSAPDTYPTGLRTFIYYPGEIVVFWDPVKSINWNAESLGYKLQWVASDSNDELVLDLTNGISSEILKIADPVVDHFVIRLNETESTRHDCHQFSISIRTFNDFGDGPWSMPVMAYVGDGDLQGELRVLSAEPANATHALLSWSWKPTFGSLCDSVAVHGFKLFCKPSDSFAVSNRTVTSIIPFENTFTTDHESSSVSNVYKIVVGGFDPTVLYGCEIIAYAQGIHYSISSSKFDLLLGIQAPDSAPLSVQLELLPDSGDGYSVRFDWKPPDINESGVSPSGYKVFVLPETVWSDPLVLDLKTDSLEDANNPAVYIRGLSVIMQYSVQLAAYGPGGIGPKTGKSTFRYGAKNSAEKINISSQSYVTVFCVYCLYLINQVFHEIS